MKREVLTNLGLNDEQIEKVMAEYSKDIQAANSKVSKNDEELQRLLLVEEDYNKLKDTNLTEVEKANKERDKALSEVKKLTERIKSIELKTKLAEIGIKGEYADRLVNSLENNTFDVEALASIITEREQLAANTKEKEIANKSTNPNTGITDSEEISEGERFAKLYNNKYFAKEA